MHPLLAAYIKCLRDPWVNPPIRPGWGCFAPTTIRTFFSRHLGNSTLANFFIRHVPWTPGAAGTIALGTSAYLQTAQDASSAASIISSATTTTGTATNFTNVDGAASVFRVIASSIRVVVRWPSTSSRGVIYGSQYRATGADMVGKSYGGYGNLAQSVPGFSNSAGELAFDVSYRPVDPNDFIFYSLNSGYQNSITGSSLNIIGTGWPANTTYDIYVITHVETMSGVDAGDLDEAQPESLASSGISLEQAVTELSVHNPVMPSANLINAIDAANTVLNNSMAGRGWMTGNGFGQSSGMLRTAASTSAASASALPPTPLHLASLESGDYELVRKKYMVAG